MRIDKRVEQTTMRLLAVPSVFWMRVRGVTLADYIATKLSMI